MIKKIYMTIKEKEHLEFLSKKYGLSAQLKRKGSVSSRKPSSKPVKSEPK